MKIPKLKSKGFSIPLGIYPFTVFVSFINVENFREVFKTDEFAKDVTEEEIKDIFSHFYDDKGYAAKTLQLNNGNILIHFKHYNSSYMMNTISHESLHAVEMILSRIGLKLNSKTDEAYCYLLGYIVEKIIKEI